MTYDFGTTADGEGFARCYASIEEKAHAFMNAYYVEMDYVRRRYGTAFMDIAHMGCYLPGARIFIRPVGDVVEIYYEAVHATGEPYFEQVSFKSMDSVPAEINSLMKACEWRREELLEKEVERANARREALLERIARERKERDKFEVRISPNH